MRRPGWPSCSPSVPVLPLHPLCRNALRGLPPANASRPPPLLLGVVQNADWYQVTIDILDDSTRQNDQLDRTVRDSWARIV
jgi:hypothetical protein